MSELERLSYVSDKMTITVIGDPSKTILMPLWGKITQIPGAWSTQLDVGENENKSKATAVIWDVMTGSIVHMFPSESVDYTILFYDMSLRRTDLRSRKYSIHDYLKHIIDMKGNYKHALCIIIDDGENERGEIIRACKTKGIKDVYVVGNNSRDIASIKSLVNDICTDVYYQRRKAADARIRTLLSG